MESGFELINLAATIAEPIPESSDDGLDPNEFLLQSHELHDTTARNRTVTPENDLTPTLLASDLLGRSKMSESEFLGQSMADSFHFVSADSIYRTTYGIGHGSHESPLEHLQKRNDTLTASTKRQIKLLNSTLESGNDCGHVRAGLMSKLGLLLENCYLLHEVYTKEQNFVESLLAQFESWDRRRSRVLRKIQLIKSQDNKHGTKLAGLLNKRLAIDDEIDQLESRILVLRENRGAVNREIEETSSILESKLAKYVNHFRELERQGREAISEYLYLSGLPEKHLEVLLKSEPVEAAFSYNSAVGQANKESVRGTRSVLDKRGISNSEKSESPGKEQNGKLTASTMGVQPLIIPEDHPQVNQNYVHGHSLGNGQGNGKTPFDRGYAKGSEQFERLRKTFSEVITQVFPPRAERRIARVDDHNNTITEKIDLVPITELLMHKLEAISKILTATSKLSAEYHDQGVLLKDIYKELDANEKQLVSLLSEVSVSTNDMLKVLEKSFQFLKSAFENQIDSLATKQPDLKITYLAVILHHEMSAVARAIGELTHDLNFEQEVPDLELSILESSSFRSGPDSRTAFKITSHGFRPTPTPTVSSQLSSAQRAGRTSPYTPTSKSTKNE